MMKLLGLVVALAVSGGIYFFYFKKMPATDAGTAPTQAISLTGVRMDLMQIANAERTFEASNGHCASLGELTSSGTMNLSRTERDGYTYEIRCEGLRVTLKLNGTQTIDYTEEDKSLEQEGLIGLQIHGGAKSQVFFRNITIEELGEKK